MQRLWISFIILLSSCSLYALPLSNPADASLLSNGVFFNHTTLCVDSCALWRFFSVRVGYYYTHVFNRYMQVDDSFQDSIRQTRIITDAGYLALNICNRVDVFGTLGATMIDYDAPGKTFHIGGVQANRIVHVETETDFSWSAGCRGTLLKWGCLAIGAEGQYFRSNPRLNWSSQANTPIRYYILGERLDYTEWQVGCGASYRINIINATSALVPYIGLKYSRAYFSDIDRLTTPNSGRLSDLESSKPWGYAVGMTLVGCNKAIATIEGDFGDEKAVYANLQFRF